jgi:predicted acylesterase/phospholipase RssA
LAKAIHEHIGSGTFDEMLTKVMIPAYDISNRRPYFFKSWKYSVRDISTHKIVCASASAPTYFPPTRINFRNGVEPKYLIDGFVAANNPAMCAYCEAKRLWGDEDIFLLSIGAGDISDPVKNINHKHWGIFTWIPRLFSIMMDAPVNTVDYQLHTLSPDLYVRLQLKVINSSEKIDDASRENIANLQSEANSLLLRERHRLERVISLIKDFKKD